MKLDRLRLRRWLVVLVVLAIFGWYIARLISVQIVQSEEIRKSMESGTVDSRTIKATRGEIVDRDGESLVTNQLGYDVVIDMAFFPSERQNEIILRLIGLFEDTGGSWNDMLPLETQEPFSFIEGMDNEVARLQKLLNIQSWSTAENAVYHLTERYDLQDYTPQEARKIAGVRYAMDRRQFSVFNPYTFASDISIELVVKIKEHSYDLSGVDIVESAIRVYDRGDVAPHLIGYVGPIFPEEWEEKKQQGYAMDDRVGKSGVESAFEEYLRGINGLQEIMSDSRGQVVQAKTTVPAELGNTIALTIDSDLQLTLQKALENQIKVLQATAPAGEGREADVGAAVAIECKTGQVLAAATFPSYDLNTYSQDYATLNADKAGRPLLNRALQEGYAPGSTFKPVTGTTGLAKGVIGADSTVFCGHVYTRFTDYRPKCLGSHGGLNINRALSVSCNIFFYDVGWNSGIEAIDKIASQYGLGEPTGIELPEYGGQRSNPEVAKAKGEKWNDGDVLQTSIGQLYQMYSPLQLANYAATIGNRGKRMQVTLVKEILDYNRTQVVKPFEAVVADRVDAPREAFETVVQGMVTASRSGSASAVFGVYPIDVAAKTGTPETSHGLPNSTFICFAPAENPEIAIAVVIEKGWHGYTGAPVAKAVMDEYFRERLTAMGYRNFSTLVPKEGETETPQQSQVDASAQEDAVAAIAAAGAPIDPVSQGDPQEGESQNEGAMEAGESQDSEE